MATKINREALRQRIKTLAGLSDDERAALLELVNTKKYGLVWENHPEEVEERLRTHLPVLDEVPERYIPGSSPSSPNHILIEGDNLEALTALTYTHEGRIDVIYIDPPYNTGNKDFSYNDHYVDADDDYRHSKWLSFMSKRLRIAKRLLSDRGTILISINTIEFAQLKILCDEIFTEKNFIGHITWESTTQPTNAGNAKYGLQQKVESILFYAKRKEIINGFRLEIQDKKRNYPNNGRYGACRLEIIEKSDAGFYNRESMKFPILGQYPRKGKRWQIGFDTAQDLIKRGRIEIDNGIVKKAVYPNDEEKKLSYDPFWSHMDSSIGTAQNGKNELNTIMGKETGFDTVKPSSLIKKILYHTTTADSIISDFFAGSGTTMHAVMQLNKEDGGHRQCILVTNNENNICEEVTYERNKRVIEGYTTPKGVEVEGLRDNSLRYYRTRLLPRQRTNRNMRDLMAAATDLLCIKEDIFEELRIQNLEIRNIRKHVRLFGKGDRLMMVIYSEEAIPRIVEWLKTTPPLPSSEGWPKAGVCSKPNRVDDRAKLAAKDTHNHSIPTPNPSQGGDAAAPPIPIDATTTTPPVPIDATTTTPPAPANATTAAPAIPSSEGWPKAGVCSKEGWPKAGVCSNPIKVYTFSYTNYAYDDDFAEVEDRVQLCALPAAIYEAYRRVLPQEDRYYDNEIIDGSDINERKEDNQ